MRNNLSKLRKIENLLIQAVIFVATCGFIYQQVFGKTDLPGLLKIMEDDIAKPGFRLQMGLILFMMVVNWALETSKWQYLIGKVERVGFLNAFEAVLAGVSISS